MTTSPPPPPAVGAGTSSTIKHQDTTLSEERASTIGWFFISSYYGFYNSGIENIYKIYHANASLTHASFPAFASESSVGEDEEIVIHKAQGIESIKGRFKNDSKLASVNNRIVITSAIFEVSLQRNILIVVFGEWAKDDSPYYQFTQTFVLTPGKTENTFDVANDVLKFIDFNEFKNDTNDATTTTTTGTNVEASEPAVVESSVDEKALNGDGDEPIESVEPEVSEETTAVATPEVTTEVVESQIEETTESTQEVEQESKQEDVDEPVSGVIVDEPVEEEKPQVPSEPLSWAALASQSAPKPKAVTPTTTKPATATVSAAGSAVKKPVAAPVAQANGKFKKEEWFPIYIRGVLDIDEKKLKDHISQTFGELKFFRLSSNIALCDFVTVEAQQKALEAKETVIDGVKISLEPRESKTANNFHNGKKSKDQKDKTGSGSSPTTDSKKKNDKKVVNNTNNAANNKKKTPKPNARGD